MRGISGWNYRPYLPASRLHELSRPRICRLAPGPDFAELEWTGAQPGEECSVMWRDRGGDKWSERRAASPTRIDGLTEGAEYEVKVACGSRGESDARLLRTGQAPGRVINYLHPEDEAYAFSGRALCSPSIIKTPSGALLASMDVFAPNAPQNLALLFRSRDRGASWHYVCDLFPCYWATLFVHRGRIYMLACSTEYGDLMIGASDDDGDSWTKPERLFSGSSSSDEEGWQHTPMPITRFEGRLYTAVDYGAWKKGGHAIGVLSVSEDADLLNSENWSVSELTAYDPNWPGAPVGECGGPLEGSILPDGRGGLVNMLRIQINACRPNHGRALLLRVDAHDPEKGQRFERFVDMPSGSNSKTHALYDEVSGKYIAIGNICVDQSTPIQRNVLALLVGDSVYDWRVAKVLLDYREDDPAMVGFQYISFIFDGDDILFQSRTALNGARNFHDANYSTFHIIKNFRDYVAREG